MVSSARRRLTLQTCLSVVLPSQPQTFLQSDVVFDQVGIARYPVLLGGKAGSLGVEPITGNFVHEGDVLRHDHDRLTEKLLELCLTGSKVTQ